MRREGRLSFQSISALFPHDTSCVALRLDRSLQLSAVRDMAPSASHLGTLIADGGIKPTTPLDGSSATARMGFTFASHPAVSRSHQTLHEVL
jgi:hypothetical protein